MPVEHSFDYITPSSKEYISLEDWIKTLTPEEQTTYNALLAEHEALDAQHIRDGYLISATAEKKLYTDEAIELAKRGEFKYVPEGWPEFFERYQRESGITLDRSIEKK